MGFNSAFKGLRVNMGVIMNKTVETTKQSGLPVALSDSCLTVPQFSGH